MALTETETRYEVMASLGVIGMFSLSAPASEISEADAVAVAKALDGLGSFSGVTLTKTTTDVTRVTANLGVEPVVFE